MINALRDRTHENSSQIDAIIAGRVLGALAVGGGGGVQDTALSIAAIQTQLATQRGVNDLRSAVLTFETIFSNKQENLEHDCNSLRREVARLNAINTTMQSQLNTLECRINRMT